MSIKQGAKLFTGMLLLLAAIVLVSPAQAAERVGNPTQNESVPDLQITDADIQFEPNPVLENGSITAVISVTNNGSSPATNILVQAYNGDPASGGVPIENGTISDIAAGETVIDTSIVFIDETSGVYNVYIVVDPDNLIPELDENNNKAQAVLTVLDDDTVPPEITNIQVAEFNGDGDGLLEDDEQIEIRWSASDDAGISQTNVSLGGCPVNSVSGLTEVVANIGPCAVGNYPFEISAADDDNSPALNTWQGDFDVVAHAPVIDSVSPEDNAQNVALSASVQAAFAYDIQAASVNSGTFVLETLAGSPLAGTVSFDAANLTATLVPDQPLETDTTYRATLKGGAGGIVDANNNILDADFNWQFSTVANQTPDLPFNPDPADTQSGVALDSSLFWQAADPENDPLSFDVYLDTVDPPANLICDDIVSTTCTPPALAFDETYYWRVDTTDEHGAARTGTVWSFNTEAAPPVCYELTVTHTGDGTDPIPSPANSEGCSAGMYLAGELISFSGAAAGAGYLIGGWTGTDHDEWATANNELTMPAADHEVAVNYVQVPAPTSLTAVAVTSSRIDLSWQYTGDPGDEIHIERSLNPGSGWVEIDVVSGAETAYEDTGLAQDTTYHYRLRVYRPSADQFSAYSNVDEDTTLIPCEAGELIFSATADAFTNSRYPDKNYGTSSTLRAKEGRTDLNSYLQFEVSGTNGAQIDSATLRLFITDSSNDLGKIFSVSNSWTEGTITWNNAPANGTLLDGSGTINGAWVEFEVAGGISGDGVFSFALVSSSSDIVKFSSKEGANPPQLIVNYNTPGTEPVIPDFTYEPDSPVVGRTVQFTDTSTGCPSSWSWDFGDGNTSTEKHPDHIFTDLGFYTVELTVNNEQTVSKVIEVKEPAPEEFYVSSSSNGSAGSVRFKDEDILVFDTVTAEWSMFLDGSDIGLGSSAAQDIDAFHLMDDGSILLSTTGATNIPDVGRIDDSDIVRFVPSSTGDDTAGAFELYFDGSDVELTTSGEDVDAITILEDGDLIISTSGNWTVAGMSGKDEDLLRFTPTTPLPALPAQGTWSLFFDGSDVGLSNTTYEEIWGVWYDEQADEVYLTTFNKFSVTGASGDGADILRCGAFTPGSDTSCTFELYWDGSENGFNREKMDALFIGR